MRGILNTIRNTYLAWLDSALESFIDPTAKLSISKSNVSLCGKIRVGKNSTLTIEDGVQFNGKLTIGDNCKMIIGKNSAFRKITINVLEGSECMIAANCIFDADAFPNTISVENGGKLELDEHVRIQADVLVRFGGVLKIGMHSSINWGSEIRCEEQVTIGEYCLMSYEVCIYDSNTHSSDWKERRETIPNRADETKRPKTKPVMIGNDVWIGKGATILKGTHIGDKSIVGIRTVVPSGEYPEASTIVSAKPIVFTK